MTATQFFDRFSDSGVVLELDTPDLAAHLVDFIQSLDFNAKKSVMSTPYMVDAIVPPRPNRYDYQLAVLEAWHWLIREGIVISRPDGAPHQFEFARKFSKARGADVSAFRERTKFPKHLLHPRLVEHAWPIYLRGDYDTAIFRAFKEVEIVVRQGGSYGDDQYGKPLMRAAFYPADANGNGAGPLTDSSEPMEEQKSLQEMFAGIYGRVRNPTAHRHGVITQANDAFEMLVMASHLLRIVEQRSPN